MRMLPILLLLAVVPACKKKPPAAVDSAVPVVGGTVTIAEEFKTRVPAGAVLFLSARVPSDDPMVRTPPLLAKRVVAPTFPYSFTLTTADSMASSETRLPPTLSVQAKLDQDGDAISRMPGDLTGKSTAPIPVGSMHGDLVLNEAVSEPQPSERIDPAGEKPGHKPPHPF